MSTYSLHISCHIVAGTREGLRVLIADGEDSSLLLLVLLVVRVETAHEEVQCVAHCKLLRAKGTPFSHQVGLCHTEVKYCCKVSLNKRGCGQYSKYSKVSAIAGTLSIERSSSRRGCKVHVQLYMYACWK